MKRLRVYADTSVFGGCFDPEFAVPSRRLFEQIREGQILLTVSTTTLRELGKAPDRVQQVLAEIPADFIEHVEFSSEVEELRDAYLDADVVGPASLSDAEHIACASVAGVDAIVSWKFKHSVHLEKIRGYHWVNLYRGCAPIAIHVPWEVIEL